MQESRPAILPEYWPISGSQVHLLVELELTAVHYAVLLRQQLAALPGATVTLYSRNNVCRLSVLFTPGTRVDQTLQEIETLLVLFSQQNGPAAEVDLLEARLVNGFPNAAEMPFWRLSERFQAASSIDQLGGFQGESLVLEPGSAFGSGCHPSTWLAVRALEEWAAAESCIGSCKALDVGTGSGVLALVCGRLGVGNVLGIDVCAQAVEVATRNVHANRLNGRVSVRATPLAEIKDRFDLVVANLTPSVLSGLMDSILARLCRPGTLIISGQMGRRAEELGKMLAGRGLAKATAYRDGPWRALRLHNA